MVLTKEREEMDLEQAYIFRVVRNGNGRAAPYAEKTEGQRVGTAIQKPHFSLIIDAYVNSSITKN